MNNQYPHSSPDKGSQELTEEFIRLRAYEIFEQRGCEHGHDLEDWLKAEEELLGLHHTQILTPVQKKRRARAA